MRMTMRRRSSTACARVIKPFFTSELAMRVMLVLLCVATQASSLGEAEPLGLENSIISAWKSLSAMPCGLRFRASSSCIAPAVRVSSL